MSRFFRPVFSLLVVAVFPISLLAAQNAGRPLILETLSTRDGLPQGTVMATLQDSQGFVWFGTEDGLVRYDGHELVRYAYSPNNANGLPGNFINALVEDAGGDLWIAVKGGGLAVWHRSTDSFAVFRHDQSNSNSIGSDTVRAVLVDHAGLIWIGTVDAGVDVLDPKTHRFQHYRHDPQSPASLIDDQVQSLFQDRTGTVWIGTRIGLDELGAQRAGFNHVRLWENAPDQVSQVIEDTTGAIWVATFDDGVYELAPDHSVKAHYRHDRALPGSLSNNDVRAVLDDHFGHLWVGTAEGLNLLNRATGEFLRYGHDKADPDSLSDSFVMSLYRDGSGLLWIGTRAGGVARWNPRSWELGGSRPEWLEGKLVTSFAEADENHIWVGSLGGGLRKVDLITGGAASISEVLRSPNALIDQRVMSLLSDSKHRLWIGTMSKGLQLLDAEKLSSIPVQEGEPKSLSAAGIMTIFEARNGLIWVGTHGGGANIIDPATGLVRQLPYDPSITSATSAENVTAFAEDREGNFWIGTDGGGLDLAHPDGTVVRVFKHDSQNRKSLSANTIYSLAVDTEGRIWAATDGGGLDLITGSSANPDSISFRNYTKADGLTSDTIYGVLPDAAGRIWLSGNAGLMRLDPTSARVTTLHRDQGLQGEEFNSGAFLRTRRGTLCFGGPGGFNVFDPLKLSEHSAPSRVVLTGLEVLGVRVPAATPYWLTRHLSLGYQSNIISLDFASLDFTDIKRRELAYRLPGLTDHWISLGSSRRVTLTNLESGTHMLEVQAVSNGEPVGQPFRLAIHKAPAPWRSVWAYMSYALAALLILGATVRAQRSKLRRALAAQHRLESEVAARTQELRATNHELTVASEAKSSFLARMGHELRTPMNGVVGMAELLARAPLSGPQARQARTILSSAQTLLRILNDLLDLSKAQVGKVELESVPIDLGQILDECAALFYAAAQDKNVDLVVCLPTVRNLKIFGDPLRLRQVAMNLLGNAVKFTEQGSVLLRCDIYPLKENQAAVEISIADTGIGVGAGALDRIFEPFTQADETTTRRFGGTGLGLAICRELVTLMGGTIRVQSSPGAGSVFSVSLLLSAEHETKEASGKNGFAKVRTRSAALRESLSRYLTLLRYEYTDNDQNAEIVFVDGDSDPEFLDTLLDAPPNPDLPMLVLASPQLIQSKGLDRRISEGRLLRKPLSKGAIRDALNTTAPAHSAPQEVRTLLQAEPIGGHILVVEDESTNAAVAEGYLTELGCTCVWVETGAAAIARLAIERFDAVLMDLNMPTLDGYETTALIRKSEGPGQRMKIVALTANDPIRYRESCLLAGMDDILTKPYTLGALAAVLRRSGPAMPTAATPALAVVDLRTVETLKQIGNRTGSDLYGRLVGVFESSFNDSMSELSLALSSEQLDRAAAACHKLKSSTSNVGAHRFSEALALLEVKCRSSDLAAARKAFSELAASQNALLAELRNCSLARSA